jgi:hypothetical protein
MEHLRLEGLSIKQLETLELVVRQRREYLIYQDRKRVRDLLMETAQQAGFSIYTLFDLPAPGGSRASSPGRHQSAEG